MKKTFLSLLALSTMISFNACSPSGNSDTDSKDTTDNEVVVDEEEPAAKKYTLTPVESPEFMDAELLLNSPSGDVENGEIEFDYTVNDYELATPTSDAEHKNCANSGKGQHIHFIVNNQAYKAHYEPYFTYELADTNIVLLSFLSRSYHESIKNGSAYTLSQFKVGESDDESVDLEAPHMFYSRPKGEYVGKDAEKVLLDFFLVNTELSEGGNYVKATINGEEHIITDWKGYFIEGLEMGDVTIKLELFDAENNLIDSPYNPVERTVTLKEQL